MCTLERRKGSLTSSHPHQPRAARTMKRRAQKLCKLQVFHEVTCSCCVVGAPTRSTLGPPRRGPEPARRGGYRRPFGRPPPHATERVRLPRRQAREFADATKPASRFPESDAGRATRVRRALPPPPFAPPGDSVPPSRLAPYRLLRCGVKPAAREGKGRARCSAQKLCILQVFHEVTCS